MRPRLALHFASRGCQEAPWILVLCAPVWVRGSAAIPCPFWGAYCGFLKRERERERDKKNK